MSRYTIVANKRPLYQMRSSWNVVTIHNTMMECIRKRAILEIFEITPSVEKILFKVAKETGIAVIVGDTPEASALPIVYGHSKVYAYNKLPEHPFTAICRWDVDVDTVPSQVTVVLVLKQAV